MIRRDVSSQARRRTVAISAPGHRKSNELGGPSSCAIDGARWSVQAGVPDPGEVCVAEDASCCVYVVLFRRAFGAWMAVDKNKISAGPEAEFSKLPKLKLVS